MPRKTKKQKQRAQTRIKEKTAEVASNEGHVKGEFEFNLTGLPQAQKSKKGAKRADNSPSFYQPGSVVRDLVKTAALAAIVFGLEIMVYLTWFK